MADRPLPVGTRVEMIILAVVGGLALLVAVVLGTLAALDRDTDNPGLAFLLVIAPFVVILAVMGLVGWLLVRRVRRNPDFRRRQLNGRAQATLSLGFLGAYLLASVARALLGVEGWAGIAVVVVVASSLYVPVFLLAKRLDPRLHWFRRPDPLPEENNEPRPSQPPW